MEEIFKQLARLANIPNQIDGLYRIMAYLFAFGIFNLVLSFISAHRAAKAKDEIKLLRAYLEGQRSAKA